MFDNLIAYMEANEILSPTLLNCSWEAENATFDLVLYDNLISKCLKLEDLNATHYFIPNKRELQQIATNHSSDI